jgi:hypothetical protein
MLARLDCFCFRTIVMRLAWHRFRQILAATTALAEVPVPIRWRGDCATGEGAFQ